MGRNTNIILGVAAILGIYITLWSYRPIVDYWIIDPPPNNDPQFGQLQLRLGIQNRGQTDTYLYLVITVNNCEVLIDKAEEWITMTSNGVKYYITAPEKMEKERIFSVNIIPLENTQPFTITYTIEQGSPWLEAWGLESHLFLEPHPNYPIYLIYNLTNAGVYELTYEG